MESKCAILIYVNDLVDVIYYLMHHRKNSGLYNLGTGKARSFINLANAVFSSLGQEPKIDFIDTPLDIKEQYQSFTQAKMGKLRSIGYNKPFISSGRGD